MSKISVIIAAYNGELTIERCMESIVQSSCNNHVLEIIIIDDGSKDSTAKIVENFIKKTKTPLIIFYKQKNSGHAEAINKGISLAKGEIIISISQDVYVSKDFICLLTETFSNKHVGIAQGPLLRISKMLKDPVFHSTIQLKPGLPYVSAAIAYRTKAIDEIGRFFDRRLSITGDDTDFALRILKKGYTYQWVPEAKAYHDLVPRRKRSIFKIFNNAPSSLVLLVKLHPELRKSLVLRLFWRGCFTGRIGSISILLFLPLLFFLFGINHAIIFFIIYFLAFLFYTWFSFYKGITYKSRILFFLPLVTFFYILTLQASFLKFFISSIRQRSFLL